MTDAPILFLRANSLLAGEVAELVASFARNQVVSRWANGISTLSDA